MGDERPPLDRGLRIAALAIGRGVSDGIGHLLRGRFAGTGDPRRVRVTSIVELIDPEEGSASSTFVVVPAPPVGDAAETIRAILVRSLEGVDEQIAADGETHDVSRLSPSGSREDLQ
jgi:hypothetical protein